MKKIKVQFVHSEKPKKDNMWNYDTINGDQLARDLEAAIIHKQAEGYDLTRMDQLDGARVQGGATFKTTLGDILFFEHQGKE